MANSFKKRREGSRTKIKSMGDHSEFLQRITRTLYYGTLPAAPGLSLPLTEVSCLAWSREARGRSVQRLRAPTCARVAHGRVSPAALVLALLYVERAPRHYRARLAPDHLFLVSLMVSNKFLQDDGEDDEVPCAEWADAGQVTPAALRRLEMDFLTAIEWNVYVSEDKFEERLRALERQVALRQAARHGFFTYNDLTSAGAGCSGAALADGAVLLAAAALAYAASLLALLGTAAVMSRALCRPAPPALARPSPPPSHAYVPNATALTDEDNSQLVVCCHSWLKRQQMESPVEWMSAGRCTWQREQRARRTEWQLEPWQQLYHAAAAPLRRWLGRLATYADPTPPPCLRAPLHVLVAASA